MIKRKTLIRLGVAALAVVMVIAILTITIMTASAQTESEDYVLIINSPYRYVNWARVGQYRAALHAHTSRSDGGGYMADHLKVFYNKGFDIVTLADHDVLCNGDWSREFIPEDEVLYRVNEWTSADNLLPDGTFRLPGRLDPSTMRAINRGTAGRFENEDFLRYQGDFPSFYTGFRTQSNGMISIGSYSVEQSASNHTLTYFAPFVQPRPSSQEEIVRRAAEYGGLSILPHPGRYTGGNNRTNPARAEAQAIRPQSLNLYLPLFLDPTLDNSLLGIEIFNRLDGDTFSDRIMWDRLLSETMQPTETHPNGRPIFGFGNDDSHGKDQIGWNWNVMLMDNLTGADFRTAMESGAFYAVARVARREGINDTINNPHVTTENGEETPTVPNIFTMYKLYQTTPGINNITAGHGVITIEGRDYDRIEWIADGEIIHTGSEFVLADHEGNFNHYVRAQLRSDYGIAMTQPFGIRMGIEPSEVNFNVGGLSTQAIFLIIVGGALVVAIGALIGTVVVIKKKKKIA